MSQIRINLFLFADGLQSQVPFFHAFVTADVVRIFAYC